MNDGEDEIYESSAHHPLDAYDVAVPDGYWMTRDDELLKISEMSDRHLSNAIAYAEQNGFGDALRVHNAREELSKRREVVSGIHRFQVTPELYSLALAWAQGVADISQPGAVVCVCEQGGANLPTVVVTWPYYSNSVGVALLVSDLLTFLGLPLPRRGS